jgi:hypothetical protein
LSGGQWWKFVKFGVKHGQCKLGHPVDLHIAALEQPFIIVLEQDGADQPGNAGLSRAPFDFFIQAFSWVRNH